MTNYSKKSISIKLISVFSWFTSTNGATVATEGKTTIIIAIVVGIIQAVQYIIAKSIIDPHINFLKKLLMLPLLIFTFIISVSLSINFYYSLFNSKKDSMELYKTSLQNIAQPFDKINILVGDLIVKAEKLATYSQKMAEKEEKRGGTCKKFIPEGPGKYNKLRKDEAAEFTAIKEFVEKQNKIILKLQSKITKRLDTIALPTKEDKIFFDNIYQEYIKLQENPLWEVYLEKLKTRNNRTKLTVKFNKKVYHIGCNDSRIENDTGTMISSIKTLKNSKIKKVKLFLLSDPLAVFEKAVNALFSFDEDYRFSIIMAVSIDLIIILLTILFLKRYFTDEIKNILMNKNLWPKVIFRNPQNNFDNAGKYIPLYYIVELLNTNLKFLNSNRYKILENKKQEYVLNLLALEKLIGNRQEVTGSLARKFNLDENQTYSVYKIYPYILEIIHDLSNENPEKNWYSEEDKFVDEIDNMYVKGIGPVKQAVNDSKKQDLSSEPIEQEKDKIDLFSSFIKYFSSISKKVKIKKEKKEEKEENNNREFRM